MRKYVNSGILRPKRADEDIVLLNVNVFLFFSFGLFVLDLLSILISKFHWSFGEIVA